MAAITAVPATTYFLIAPLSARAARPVPGCHPGRGLPRRPDTLALEPRQHLVTEERQLVDVVDERDRDAGQAGAAQIGQLPGYLVGIADDRQAAHALRILVAPGEELLHRHGLRRDVL